MTLPLTFFNPKQAREKANHSSKKKTKGKKREKNILKVEKPKAIGHFPISKNILIFAHAWAKMS